MKYALIALALTATPALADCYNPNKAMMSMNRSGYQITFGQAGDAQGFYVAQSPDGKWIAFVMSDSGLCIIATGDSAINYPLPPNA